MTDDEFFTATDQLRTIRDWAHARYAAAWAVLLQVLVRVSVSTDPNVQLPGVIGGRASLNLLAAFVSPSGGGKGISDKVARLAWPAPIIERPIGSGEGIAATFVPPKKEGVEPITRALITVPEVDTLAGLAGRQGSILLAQLKSMAMGEQLGQSNASEATTRIIPEHSYRACMSVGAQPAHCSVIFSDTTGGTPQRFLWAMTIDPDMPEDAPDDPEPLDTRLPLWAPGMDGVVEIGYGPDEIPAAIKAAHIARQRGDADALDGHAMLTRCKVAAVLAILHHRSVVSELDWELSGAVMEQSDRTRDWVIAEGKRSARQKVRERAMSRAAGEEFIDQRRMDTVKRRILTVLERGPLAGGKLRAALGRREYRDLFDRAAMALEFEGSITADSSGSGTRYSLSEGLNTEHPVQPLNAQYRGAEHLLNTEHPGSNQKPRLVPATQGQKDMTERERTDSVKRRVMEVLTTEGSMSGGYLTPKLSGRLARDLFVPAVEELIAEGHVERIGNKYTATGKDQTA